MPGDPASWTLGRRPTTPHGEIVWGENDRWLPVHVCAEISVPRSSVGFRRRTASSSLQPVTSRRRTSRSSWPEAIAEFLA